MLKDIRILRKVSARSKAEAQRCIRSKYPHSLIVTYRFDKDYKYVNKDERDYNHRTMTVAIVEDVERVRKEMQK